eukprot:gb/GECH01012281.1/.p1 GENE.gb/GECH01012281.1/~~gb/GECH01012281.1/.p1  ORF type:complete len:343 (+),score=57.82 gb/GECH01012281.1/:1-1029(+)
MQPVTSFQGHRKPITSLCSLPQHRMLLSASEDGTVRIWDTRIEKTTQCIAAFQDDHGHREEVTDVTGLTDGNTVICSAGRRVYEVDLRKVGKENMIVTEMHGVYDVHDEEVNCVHVCGENGRFVCSVDDAGCIVVTERGNPSNGSSAGERVEEVESIPIENAHSNICSTVLYRQSSPDSPLDIISSGYDFKIIRWSFDWQDAVYDITGAVLVGSINPAPGQSQAVNPPFVYSIDQHPHRPEVVAAALGSNMAVTVDLDQEELRNTFRGVHCHAVSCILYFGGDGSFLVTGSLDQHVALWKESDQTCSSCIRMPGGINSVVEGEDDTLYVGGSWNSLCKVQVT